MLAFVVRWLIQGIVRDLIEQYLPQLVLTLGVAVYLLIATVTWALSVIAQPGGIYWLASQAPPEVQAAHPLGAPHTTTGIDLTPSGTPIALPGSDGTPIPVATVGPIVGRVTDAQRYALALQAGWTPSEAIIATAISIAEDGSGDPAALSPPNFDNSRDLGLWQINSGHWGQSAACGSHDALIVPVNNAICGHSIYGPGHNWCAWSTYGTVAQCGRGHNNAEASWEACAIQISLGRIEQCPR